MKSIVVPVNFSPCATNAANYAADLAKVIHADLYLIHVLQVPVSSAELAMTPYLYETMVESASVSLKELQLALAKRTNNRIRIETSLEAGSLGAKVKELCLELQPYAIVAGAAGPNLNKMVAGSSVTSMLHNLDFPILVVPESYTFHRFHRILLACDLEDMGSGIPYSLPLLKDLRDHFGSRFDIVTVETRKILREEQHVFDSDGWKNNLKELYPELHYVRKPKVEDGILEYLAHNEVDLILVFPKKHGFFDFHISQSRKLAQNSPIPVLSLHA